MMWYIYSGLKERQKKVTRCVVRYTKGGKKGGRYNVKETRGEDRIG
jgi:hypothetical protein